MGRPGKTRVLRLLETFPADEVHAVQDAISRGATGYDAVKHLLLRIEGRPPRLDLAARICRA